MITPGLYRRALRGGLQWRLLALFWASLLVPGTIAALPAFVFLGRQLDHWTGAKGNIAWMDGATFIEIFRQLGENGAGRSIGYGLVGAALVALLVAPFVAGATVAAAGSEEPLPVGRLLAGAGETYGRMLRTSLAGLIPLGAGAALAGLAVHLVERANRRAVRETAANRNWYVGLLAASALVFVFHLLVDAARAQFAAEPHRRSGLLALWSAARLLVRRPLRVLAVGAVGAGIGLGLAGALMALRLDEQAGPARIALAWLLAQGAQLAVGWGRATRIHGLAELARVDAAARQRAETFWMEPPTSSPAAESSMPAMEPPRSGAAR